MKALTLWPEWAWAIVHAGKNVENRTWAPPRSLIGKRIAIHAGAYIGGRKGAPATREGIEALASAMAHAGRPLESADGLEGLIARGAIVGTACLRDVVFGSASPWAAPDAFHWLLADVEPVWPPVEIAGAQGLWDVPGEIRRRCLP